MYLLLALSCTPAQSTDDAVPQDDTSGLGHDTGEPAVDPDEREANLSSGPGDYAADFLAARDYDRIEVEVDWVTGAEPDSDALDSLADVLAQYCDKPGGVEIVMDDALPEQGEPAWDYNAAEDLEVQWRDRYRDPDSRTAVFYLLFVDGHSDRDTSSGAILGYAYHGSSVIMFQRTIDGADSGLPLLAGIEDVVLAHEAGHILGLVNNGAPMTTAHEDPEHSGHDANEDCLMYWAVETDAVAEILGTNVPEFDEACVADMAAVRGD